MKRLCCACNEEPATIEILDLDGDEPTSKLYCYACANSTTTEKSVTLPSEIIETLFGGVSVSQGDLGTVANINDLVCPGCKLTAADFKLRGRLGCPRCYEVFRPALLPLLERVHDATCHRGRRPATAPGPLPSVDSRASTRELQRRLRAAVEEERYEDAANLRDELEKMQHDEERDADGGT